MPYKDYYSILGVDKNAGQEDIKKAFRALVKKYHPDVNPGDKAAEDKFKDINEAYEVLGDSEKRRRYDSLGEDYQSEEFTDNGDVWYRYRTNVGRDHSGFFNIFFSGWPFDIDDFFDNPFSKRREYTYAVKGEDIEAPIELSIEDGFEGVKKKLTVSGPTGTKNITLKIPKGVKEGERIRLKGQGEPGRNGGEYGDLYLKVAFIKDGKYEIDGKDLHMSMDIMPWDAALGTEKTIDIIDGRITVKIPPGVQTDTNIRIGNKGYVDRNGKRGDLYINIKIVNPDNITPQVRRLYERLRTATKID